MGWQVHWYPGDRRREIGTVIEIEAAQIVLVRLSLTAMLAHNHAWHGFQDLAGSDNRPGFQLFGCDRAFTAGRGYTDEVFLGTIQIRKIAERQWCGHRNVCGR